MAWLPFTNLGQLCRPRYKYTFSAAPILFMLLSFIPLFVLSHWMAGEFGISMTAPLKGQPHANLVQAIIWSAMVIFMIAGYLLGFLFNAVVLVAFFRWPSSKLKELFLESQLPAHWYRPEYAPDERSIVDEG